MHSGSEYCFVAPCAASTIRRSNAWLLKAWMHPFSPIQQCFTTADEWWVSPPQCKLVWGGRMVKKVGKFHTSNCWLNSPLLFSTKLETDLASGCNNLFHAFHPLRRCRLRWGRWDNTVVAQSRVVVYFRASSRAKWECGKAARLDWLSSFPLLSPCDVCACGLNERAVCIGTTQTWASSLWGKIMACRQTDRQTLRNVYRSAFKTNFGYITPPTGETACGNSGLWF